MQFTFVKQGVSQNETVKEPIVPPAGKLAIIAGAGNYEYLHAGLNVSLKHKYYFETAIGIKPWGFEDRYMMAYVCFGGRFLKEKEKPKKLKPYIHLKLLCWDLDNPYNHFTFLGVNPEIRIAYSIKNRMQLCGNIGGVYNTKLYYERKTYEEVGWPKEWQPSFSVQLLYWIK